MPPSPENDTPIIEALHPSQLDELSSLWGTLNAHHRDLCPPFRDAYSARTWAQRRTELLTKASRSPFLVLAARSPDGAISAYCIASVSPEGLGELDSLFVSTRLRGHGLGNRLARTALAWMDTKGATAKRVVVYTGNERAQRLYTRLGFAPRQVVMELPTNAWSTEHNESPTPSAERLGKPNVPA